MCGVPARPELPKLNLPGLSLAMRITSATDLAGRLVRTASTLGAVDRREIGSKLFSALKRTFL